MGRTVSNVPGYAPDDEFDPRIDDFVASDRSYLHFDLPLSDSARESLRPTNRDYLSHAFWPLIGYTAEERRVRKDSAGALSFELKERPIKFGSHADAALLQCYTQSLSRDYEAILGGDLLANSVLAYRKGIGNNIDHSKALFDEIRKRKNCIAIAMDISGFFDHIRHSNLYAEIMAVRRVRRLNEVDYLLYRRLTRFEWVESDDLVKRLGGRYGRKGRICFPREFRKLVRASPSAVQVNLKDHGIPQGTPLSGLYANLSMLGFDRDATQLVTSLGGTYRRYSDDLAFLLPNGTDVPQFIDEVGSMLIGIGLTVSAKKTEIRHFKQDSTGTFCEKPFQYLGFTFDGKRTLIRQSSLNRYYSKMARGIRAKVRAAESKSIPSDQIFMRELFKKYTHFGQNRNFPRYAYRASAVHSAPEIKHQISRHMDIFKKMVRTAIDSIY